MIKPATIKNNLPKLKAYLEQQGQANNGSTNKPKPKK